MILVTGGTGLVGSHLLLKLVQQKQPIRATYRKGSDLERVKTIFSYHSKNSDSLYKAIEWIEADLNDLPNLTLAFDKITTVYHCAAYISFDPSVYKILRDTNIVGTANIVNLCIEKKVQKLCHVSSVATLGYAADVITEDTHWQGNHNQSVYAISKYGAEMEIWRATQEGIPAIIVNPGVIIGPGFWNRGSGLLFKIISKKQSYFTKGSTGFIGVDDVTQAMVDLMASKIENQRYILVAENLSHHEFMTNIAKQLGVNPPTKLATKYSLCLALCLDYLQSKLLGKRRRLSKALCQTLTKTYNFSSKKIKKDLKTFEFTPISQVIEQSCQYFF